jgi:hypothetical protein
MNKDPVHSKTIVEEEGLIIWDIDQYAGKSAVQLLEKPISFLLVEMNQVRTIPFLKGVPFSPQIENSSGFGKNLSFKEENHIPPLIENRHTIGKRAFMAGPSDIGAHVGMRVDAMIVKGFVQGGFAHHPDSLLT